MTNMTKDYYKILGVNELCTEQELKSAYRKLARKYHPDVAGNTPDSVSKFKEINEAYEVLSNKTKRSEYDTVNRFYNYSSTTSNNEKQNNGTTTPDDLKKNKKTEEQKKTGFNFNWEEFVSKYKEYTNKYEQSKSKDVNIKYGNAKRGKDISTDVEITIAEAVTGTSKVINMLNIQVCPKCSGRKFVNGSVCPHCKGKGDISEHKRFTVKIPAGIKDKSKIRLAGEGEKGINGGKNGDLYITVNIKAPLDYKTDGNNILKTIYIAPYEAVLGADLTIRTPDGNVSVKIAPNTQSGQKIRLSGCGINNNGKIGDMILTIEICINKNLSEQEINLYKQLKEIASANVR